MIIDKTTMAADYLPTVPASQYYGDDGRLYGGDLRKYFVGNPFTEGGYICGIEAILNAADTYLQEIGSPMWATDKTGASPEELYELVSQDTPVVVWVTIGMTDRSTLQGWYTESGDYVDWSTSDHGAVLVGYSKDTVTIADPISGLTEYSRTQFEKVFSSRSCQCVILEA
nr:C39 family peptidase [uncultured Blautia sp.]